MKRHLSKSLIAWAGATLLETALVLAAQASHLVQYWPLEETGASSATNAVSGGNTALIVNQSPATAWEVGDIATPLATRSTAAVSLDGQFQGIAYHQDYLDGGPLHLFGNGAVSMWVKPQASIEGMRIIAPMNDEGFKNGAVGVFPFSSGQILLAGWNLPGNSGAALGDAALLPVGTWTHVVYSFSGGVCTMWINGVAAGTNYSCFNFDTSRLGVGGREHSTAGYNSLLGAQLTGYVDDLSVWDGPVSSNTVAQLYAGTVPTAVTDVTEAPKGAKLVQYYPLEEASGSTTSANLIGPNAGTLINFDPTVCWLTNSPSTSNNVSTILTNSTTALWFSGQVNAYLNLGVLGLPGRGTVSLWVNSPTNVNVLGIYEQIDGGTAAVPGGLGLDASGQLRVNYFSTTRAIITPANTVKSNNWYHIAVVYDNGYATAYVNGVRQGTAYGALLGFSKSQMGIGAPLLLQTANNAYFTGGIDDISIWDGPLGASSIQQLARGVSPTNIVDAPEYVPLLSVAIQAVPAAQLKHYWPLDDGPGSGIATNMVNSTNGILVAFTNLLTAWVTNMSSLAPNLTSRSTAALFFDGGTPNYLYACTNNMGPQATPSGTISLWVNPSDITDSKRVFSQTNNFAVMGNCGITSMGQVWLNDGVSTTPGLGTFEIGSTPNLVTTNMWYHFAFTYENGYTTFYLNGVRQQSVKIGFTPMGLAFGNLTRLTQGNAFAGMMDDISIWTHSLSDSSIAQLAAGVSPTAILEPSREYAVLKWPAYIGSAILERAPSVIGPWTRVSQAGQPFLSSSAANSQNTVYLDYDPSVPAQFYRLRR